MSVYIAGKRSSSKSVGADAVYRERSLMEAVVMVSDRISRGVWVVEFGWWSLGGECRRSGGGKSVEYGCEGGMWQWGEEAGGKGEGGKCNHKAIVSL